MNKISSFAKTRLTAKVAILRVAPENPRSNETVDDAKIIELSDNIAEMGLITPLVGYEDAGLFHVTAGGRRVRAIQRLAADGHFTDDAEMPIVLMSKDDAVAAGHAEQLTHVGMSESDELRVYLHPAYKDLSVGDLARRLGKSNLAVRQRRLVADLPKRVLDAVWDGTINANQAFGLTYFIDDETAMDEMVEHCSSRPDFDLNDLRHEALRSKTEWDRCKLTNFATREEYLAAGGTLQEDLFAGTALINNMSTLKQIVHDKAPSIAQEQFPDAFFFSHHDSDLHSTHWGINDLTEEEEDRWHEIQYSCWSRDRDSDDPEDVAFFEEWDRLKQKSETYYPDDLKKMLGVTFEVNEYTGIRFRENIIPTDREPLYEAGYLKRPAATPETSDEGDAPTEPDPVFDAVPKYVLESIARLKLHAARMELVKTPPKVFDIYLRHLAGGRTYGAFDPMPQQNYVNPDLIEVTWSKQAETAQEMMSLTGEDISALSAAQQRSLLAWRILACSTTELDTSDFIDKIRSYWTPDADFLGRYRKPALVQMLNGFGHDDGEALMKLKAKALAERLAVHAAKTKDWLPIGF